MHLVTARVTDAQGQRAEALLQVEVLPTDRFRWMAGSDMLALAIDGPAGLDASAPGPVWRRDNRRTASVPQ